MKVIDLDLFDPEAIEIKTGNTTYNIKFIPANLELRLLQLQPEVNEKASDFRKLTDADLTKWKDVIKKICAANHGEIEEKTINCLSVLQVIAVMMALLKYINERSQVIYQAFDEATKTEIKKIENDIKKKTTSA
jgi:hypothetical protein